MRLKGILIASAAIGLLAGGVSCAGEQASAEEVKCAGINSCGGKGECAAADGSHDCGGKNSCKGKGWTHTDTSKQCMDRGGTVVD